MGTSAPAVAPPAAPAQGGNGNGQSQPGATGQGQAAPQSTGTQQGQGGSFNWGLFPDVPEAQRELLQPHLTNVLGHVTRMEQQMAPYKGFMDNVPADQVEGLMQFLNNFNDDPIATWLGMANSFVENGQISAPGFSVDALQALIAGQVPGQSSVAVPGATAPDGGEIPPWAQEMQSQLQAYQQAEQQRQQAQEAQQNEAILAEAHQGMREQLVAAGVAQEIVQNLTPEQLSAAIITHGGDVNAATQSFVQLRDGFLGGFVQQNGNGKPPAQVNGDLNTPKTKVGKGRSGDKFRQASLGAEQMLRQGAQANAQ